MDDDVQMMRYLRVHPKVVSRWVQDYYEDFLDPQQRAKLVAFIEQDVAPPFPSVANGMKLGLAQRQVHMVMITWIDVDITI